MNQQCKVCGEPAAGFHFGAFTCEGCKSFFGRTYNNLSSISECKNNRDCIINKKNRTSCKACRLRKCLLVGMSKSGSRFGRRSNWFKIHCLLQEQQHQHQQKTSGPQNIDHIISANSSNQSNQSLIYGTTNFLTNIKTERKRKKSSSDSGASSTEPDYNNLNNRDCFLHQPHYSTANTKSIINSTSLTKASFVSDALSPFLLSSNDHHLPTFLDISPKTSTKPYIISTMATTSTTNNLNFNLLVQNEPMDLSVKSRKSKQSPTSSSSHRSCKTSLKSTTNLIGNDIAKPTPLDLTLDLTLVQSKTLSG